MFFIELGRISCAFVAGMNHSSFVSLPDLIGQSREKERIPRSSCRRMTVLSLAFTRSWRRIFGRETRAKG
jgi:hypothetical protein